MCDIVCIRDLDKTNLICKWSKVTPRKIISLLLRKVKSKNLIPSVDVSTW